MTSFVSRQGMALRHPRLDRGSLKPTTMTDKNTELNQEQVFDPLDMNNYKVEKLPKMEKSGFEKCPYQVLIVINTPWRLR